MPDTPLRKCSSYSNRRSRGGKVWAFQVVHFYSIACVLLLSLWNKLNFSYALQKERWSKENRQGFFSPSRCPWNFRMKTFFSDSEKESEQRRVSTSSDNILLFTREMKWKTFFSVGSNSFKTFSSYYKVELVFLYSCLWRDLSVILVGVCEWETSRNTFR